MYNVRVGLDFGMLSFFVAVWLGKTKVGWLFFTRVRSNFVINWCGVGVGVHGWGGLVSWWCDLVFRRGWRVGIGRGFIAWLRADRIFLSYLFVCQKLGFVWFYVLSAMGLGCGLNW